MWGWRLTHGGYLRRGKSYRSKHSYDFYEKYGHPYDLASTRLEWDKIDIPANTFPRLPKHHRRPLGVYNLPWRNGPRLSGNTLVVFRTSLGPVDV